MADVFLSYARADAARAATLAAAATASGRSIWWDRKLAAGEDYGQVIERELAAASAVVVAWSKTARDSLWVRAEANAALDAGKIVQLNLDGSALPLPFTMLHALDYRSWAGRPDQLPWPETAERIAALIGEDAPDTGGRRPNPGGVAWMPPPERALQGFGQAALIGWTALAAALLIGLLTVAVAQGTIAAGTYGVVVVVLLVLAVGLFGLAAFLLGRSVQASRR